MGVKELRKLWPFLGATERLSGFRALDRKGAEDFILNLPPADKAKLLMKFPETERRTWVRYFAPDDVAKLVRQLKAPKDAEFLALLDEPTRKEVSALLAYAEDEAGGLMNPLFVRLRPGMSVDESISYLRKQTQERSGAVYYAYVLDSEQKLKGVISFRQLLTSPPQKKVEEVMHHDPVFVTDTTSQEEISRIFQNQKLMAVPVVDDAGHMKGIVSLDDMISVVQQKATDEIQKIGGSEALDEPYLQISLFRMIKKRAGWLSALFLGEMLTATAMGYFEAEIASAVVLALFLPLIISSGRNSGSQATTLVIRALALREIRLIDWWRVIRREILSGFLLGCILGSIGFLRIMIWQFFFHTYKEDFLLVGMTVACSLVGVVTFGTFAGSMLPFILKKLKFDPASASAPFVATLVDVTGLIIYFTVASVILLHGMHH